MTRMINRFLSWLLEFVKEIVKPWFIEVLKEIVKPKTLANNLVLGLIVGLILSYVVPTYLIPHPDMSLTCNLKGKNKIIKIENHGESAAEDVYVHTEFRPHGCGVAFGMVDAWSWKSAIANNSFSGLCLAVSPYSESEYDCETLWYRKYVLPGMTSSITMINCENSQIKVKLSGKNFGSQEVKC